MKNVLKAFGIIAFVTIIGFSMAACDDDSGGGGSSDGSFTLTNIPSQYNGKYAWLTAKHSKTIWGAQSVSSAGIPNALVRVSGGTVSIPLWEDTNRYSGNDTCDVDFYFDNSNSMYDPYIGGVSQLGFASVKFSNGSATRSYNDGRPK